MTEVTYLTIALAVAVVLTVGATWNWRDVVDIVTYDSHLEPDIQEHIVALLVTAFVIGAASMAWPLTALVLATLLVKGTR